MTAHTPRWRRHFFEGFTIVASILLAFGIDAWWEDYQEDAEVSRQLVTLRSEMESNREALLGVGSRGAGNVDSTRKLISLMRPRPDPIGVDSLVTLFDSGFNLHQAALEVAALTGLLEDPDFGSATHPDLYPLLVQYRATLDYYSASEELFFEARSEVVLHLASVMPAAAVSARTGAHGPSGFEVDVGEVLSNQELEGLLGYLAITATFLNVQAAGLQRLTESTLEELGGSPDEE